MIKHTAAAAAALFVALIAGTLFTSCTSLHSNDNYISDSGFYFDTYIDIKISTEGEYDASALLAECMDKCAEYEDILSAYKEGSELFGLNAGEAEKADNGGYVISRPLYECISLGLQYGEMTGGAFDISIFPVSSLWIWDAETPALPDDKDIRKALEYVDCSKISVGSSEDEGAAGLADGLFYVMLPDGMKLDLGGIAKGYISGKLADYLEECGVKSAVINLGGNVRAIGSKNTGDDWVIGIQKPFSGRGEVIEKESISGLSVISSGDYERYFILDDKLYYHILDPDTGYCVNTDVDQITIVGTDDVLGDVLASSGMVLGVERLMEIIESNRLDVKVIVTYNDASTKRIN